MKEKSPGGAAFRTRRVRPTFVLSLGRRARQMRQIHRHEGVWARRPIDAAPFLLCRAQRSTRSERTRASRRGVVRIQRRCACFGGTPTRTRKTHDLLEKFLTVAGIRLHIGKTRTCSAWRSSTPSCGAHLESKFLVPLWDGGIQQAASHKRKEEDKLWRAIPSVPLQCAWQLLVQCAVPRCHHFVRAIPRS